MDFGGIDRSSWVSWACYAITYILALDTAMDAEIHAAGPGLWVLLGGVVVFFALIIPIQRHMQFSLSDRSYGEPKRLVTSGPFQWSRNPIYVAFLVPLAAFAWFSPAAAAAGIAIYLIAMTYLVIAREEAVLEREFSSEFRAYRARTPRWLVV